jgi:hypothetical protein
MQFVRFHNALTEKTVRTMSSALGKRVDKELLNHLFGKTPDTTPAGVLYISLHTGDPGNDGQTANEATGSAYARVTTAATDWNAATNAEPSVTTNANAITFPTATGNWSSGTNFTYIGIWKHLTNTGEADFIGRAALTVAKPVMNGDTLSIAAGSLSISLD